VSEEKLLIIITRIVYRDKYSAFPGNFLSFVLETTLKFHLPDGLISEFNKEEREEFLFFLSK